MVVLLVVAVGCKKNEDIPTPPGPQPPDPPDPPVLTEKEIAKMYYHDDGANSDFDIYSADLYIVPIEDAAQASSQESSYAASAKRLDLLKCNGAKMLNTGVSTYRDVPINGRVIERVVIDNSTTSDPIDITKYNFEVRNVTNLTNSTADDFAVNVSGDGWICFVTAPDGLANNSNNTQICYMNLADMERKQLTPINGQYSSKNVDPDWKTNTVIVWSSQGEIHEVDINELEVSASLVPEIESSLYDPKYSPDGNMVLFNNLVNARNKVKHSYIKYLTGDGGLQTVLPADYFASHSDDNPTWLFANDMIAGHLYPDKGTNSRIYTRNFAADAFNIITDGSRDFRYVQPIKIDNDIYLVFSDWTDQSNIALWISNIDGSLLRELNQTGDEVVFQLLGLPAPTCKEDLSFIARQYAMMFQYD